MVVGVLVEITSKSVDRIFDYKVKEELVDKIKIGLRVKVPFGTKELEGFVLEIKKESNYDKLKEIIDVVDTDIILTDELLDLGKYISKITLAPLISCYQVMLPKALKASIKTKINKKYEKVYYLNNTNIDKLTNKQQEIIDRFNNKEKLTTSDLKDISLQRLNILVNKGILKIELEEVYRIDEEIVEQKINKLTIDQEDAVNKILTSDKKTYLLHGVTGSGKTEVYMELIARTLESGKKSIVLVPEISLTPQMVKRFKSRFGKKIAAIHSALSEGEKYDEYRRISKGEVDIVIGARSAIFAPLSNIGMIIIDEEHSDSYKQDNTPRYNAKDIALYRAKTNNAKVILGSATPTLETYARAKKNVYELIELKKRINGKQLPSVTLIDMNKEIKTATGHFSKPLINAINETIKRNEQVILLLNHRGYSSVVTCKNCGEAVKCPNCDITLTYHKKSNILRCHYCGYGTKYEVTCPHCKKDSLRDLGVGTEKIEEEIKEIFENAKVIRMDVDTTSTKGSHKKMIESFAKGEANILLGTQIVAKGLDFRNVTLVGVINADTSLMIPDFRSNEVTFSLLNQVAGRSGRSEKDGKVIFQTYNPDNYAIKYAKENNYQAFYNEEMKIRHLMKYPPYYYIISIKLASKDMNLALIESRKCEKTLSKYLDKTIILGPSPTTVFKKQNIYRYQLILKYKYQDNLYEVLEKLVNYYAPNNKVKLELDFNPLHL